MLKTKLFKPFWVGFLLLHSYQIYSQPTINNDYAPRILPHSPDANALGKYGDLNLDLSTGTINQKIPLFSLPVNQNSIEIELNYSSNGIKVDEYESSVGVGWVLNLGGVINRTLFDKPDEKNIRLPAISEKSSLEEYRNYLVNTDSKDTQPDIFSFNVNGLSGAFFLDDNGNAILINQEDIKIELNNNDSNTEIKITDKQGTNYYFGGNNFTENNTSLVKCTQIGGTSSINENLMINNIDASWYLNKIEYNNGSYIHFKYKELKPITYLSGVSEKMELKQYLLLNIEGKVSSPIYKNCITHTIVKTKLLEEVVTSSGNKVVIDYESKYQDESDFLRIKNIKLKNFLNEEIKSIYLNYEIVVSKDNYWAGEDKNLYKKFPYLNKRIFLSEIHEYNNKTIQLKYIDPENLPSRLSYSQDNFGYYNGAHNKNFISFENLDIPVGAPKLISANRYPNARYAQYGLLSKIIYPTKGSTSIEYEGNTSIENHYNDELKYSIVQFESAPFITSNIISTQFIEIHSGRVQLAEFSLSKYFDYDNQSNDMCRMYMNENFYPGIISGSITMKIFNKKTNKYLNFQYSPGKFSDNRSVGMGDQSLSCSFNKIKTIENNERKGYTCTKSYFFYPKGNSHISIEPILKSDVFSIPSEYIPYMLPLDYDTDYRIEITKKGPCHIGAFSITYYDTAMGKIVETSKSAPGMRVKQITNIDTKNIKLTKYHYGKENCLDDCSSGELNKGVNVNTQTFFTDIFHNGSATKTYFYDSNSLISLYSVSRPPVSYMRVFKEIINVNEQSNQLTQYFFDIKQDEMPSPYFNYYFIIPNTPMSNIFGNGKLLREIEYSKEMQPIRIKEYTYLFKKKNTYISLSNLKFRYAHVANNNDYSPSDYTFMKYNINYAFYYLDNIEEILISEPISISNKTFYYYDSPNHLQLTSQSTKTSTGGELITKYQYPPDNNNNPIMKALTEQNRISTPFSTEILRKENEIEKTISFTETQYVQDASTSNLILPKYVYAKKGEAPLEKKITYDLYDNKGNLLQYTLEAGIPVSLIWGYNQQYPIAKIEGATYAEVEAYVANLQNISNNSEEQALLYALDALRKGLPKSMLTSYTYQPLVGVSSITPPNGITEYYIYDASGRLKEIKNQQGQLLKSFEYHYKSQN